MESPQFKVEIPFSIERLRDDQQLNLIKQVKHQALLMLFDEMLKDVPDFGGFNADCNISMEVHSYHSVSKQLNELKTSNVDTTFLYNEMDRLRALRDRLSGFPYGDTHLMELTVTTK